MYPWLWFWAPQFHFPFSGSVAQRIEPDTRWFFEGIRPEAGNGDVEQQIFDVASYGRQLGLITEVLLSQASPGTIDADQAAKSLGQLGGVYRDVEDVKRRNCDRLARSAVAALEKLQAGNPAELARVLARFSQGTPLLEHQRSA
ncbi:MAG: hypothetical protein ABI409_17845 [Ramlibacter sp.]